MELGRLYAFKGQLSKANRAVENALYLDKNNRFISRSASRFFHHFSDDTEKALHTIRSKKENSIFFSLASFSFIKNGTRQ